MKRIFPPVSMRAALHGAVLSLVVHSAASASEWQVTRLVGQAWTTSELGTRSSLGVGAILADRATVVTGERSRAMLVRGRESMTIGPVSVVAIAERPDAALSTTVMQKAGSVTFDVEHRDVQHFEVETPVLAAVVKGTRFTVTVGQADGGVGVSRGAVEVTALATGQRSTVTVGQRADVGTHGMNLSGSRARDAVMSVVPPRAAVVAAVSEVSPATVVSAAEIAAAGHAAGVVSGVSAHASAATASSHSTAADNPHRDGTTAPATGFRASSTAAAGLGSGASAAAASGGTSVAGAAATASAISNTGAARAASSASAATSGQPSSPQASGPASPAAAPASRATAPSAGASQPAASAASAPATRSNAGSSPASGSSTGNTSRQGFTISVGNASISVSSGGTGTSVTASVNGHAVGSVNGIGVGVGGLGSFGGNRR